MQRIWTIGMVLVVVCALGAAAATAASAATEGPFFGSESKRLLVGETRAVKVKSVAKEYLLVGEVLGIKWTTTCKALKLNSGAGLLGSIGANAGKGDEILEYGECSVTGNGTGCKVKGSAITTNLIKSELAYSTKERAGPILTIFTPSHGSVFVTVHYEGSCTFSEGEITGSAAAEAADSTGKVSEVNKEGALEMTGELISTGAKSTKYWSEAGGVLTEHTAELKDFGSADTLAGTSVVELGSGQKWGVRTH